MQRQERPTTKLRSIRMHLEHCDVRREKIDGVDVVACTVNGFDPAGGGQDYLATAKLLGAARCSSSRFRSRR